MKIPVALALSLNLLVTVAWTAMPPPAAALPIVVNSTSDINDGVCDAVQCSLREAINAANSNVGPDTIAFDIPGDDPGCAPSGVCTIEPAELLPWLTDDATTIDGYTQPGATPGPSPILKIVLDGHNNDHFSGLSINSGNNLVRGLVIQRFTPFAAIDIFGTGARDNCIEGNFIGTDASGTQPRGNCTPPTSCAAIWLHSGATDNTVGPDNLIAYNGQGVWITGTATQRNTITRNSIHGNEGAGIRIADANGLMDPPRITALGPTEVSGTACASCMIEVFSDEGDEGAIYEGTATADASKSWVFTKALGLAGPKVTATATNSLGNTSEFSIAMSLPQPTTTTTITPTQTPTRTPTATPSATLTATAPPSPTSTETSSPTATVTLTNTPTATGTPTEIGTPLLGCVGDCSDNSLVTVEELVKGVNIALGTLALAECRAFDFNGNLRVTVDELVQGVNNALGGCL